MDRGRKDIHADERKIGRRIIRVFYQPDDSTVLCHLGNAELPGVVDFLQKDEGIGMFFCRAGDEFPHVLPDELSAQILTKDEPFRSLFEIFTARARPAGESCGIE